MLPLAVRGCDSVFAVAVCCSVAAGVGLFVFPEDLAAGVLGNYYWKKAQIKNLPVDQEEVVGVHSDLGQADQVA